jgi:hypothetical protein
MAQKTILNVAVQNSLNRAMIYTCYPMGKPANFIIYHHRKTSALQFDVDSRSVPIKNNQVKVSMFRNLESCPFSKIFFKLENLKTDSYDYQGKFGGVEKLYEQYCYPFMKEKLDFQSGNSNDISTNYMLVMGWKLFDLEDELLFFFVQRRCYNTITRSNIIRTAGLQFSTDKGIEILNKYYEKSENDIRKVDDLDFLKETEDT